MAQASALTISLLAAEEGDPKAGKAVENCRMEKMGLDDKSGALDGSRSISEVSSRNDQLLCMYENLTDHQAKQLLIYHGQKGSFLFVKRASGLTVHIRLGEEGRPVYSKHTIVKDGQGYTMEGSSTAYQSSDDLIQCLVHQYSALGVALSPLFAPSEDLVSASPSTSFSVPPEYSVAQRYPNAPAKDLPSVRMLTRFTRLHTNITNSLRYPTPSTSGHFSISSSFAVDNSPGCLHNTCHQFCHLDPEGRWWYPCKAAPAMCILLTVVWAVIFVLFGWLALLVALALGSILTVTAVCAFLQTGQCYCKEVFCCEGQLEQGAT